MDSQTPRRVLLATIAAAALPASALAAKPIDTGNYFAKPNSKGIYAGFGVSGGKIYSVNATLKFTKNGKTCSGGSGSAKGAPISVYVTLKKDVAPKADGSFSLSRTSGNSSFPAKFTLKGRFTSSKNAKLSVSAKYKGCKASYSTSKARYTTGG